MLRVSYTTTTNRFSSKQHNLGVHNMIKYLATINSVCIYVCVHVCVCVFFFLLHKISQCISRCPPTQKPSTDFPNIGITGICYHAWLYTRFVLVSLIFFFFSALDKISFRVFKNTTFNCVSMCRCLETSSGAHGSQSS